MVLSAQLTLVQVVMLCTLAHTSSNIQVISYERMCFLSSDISTDSCGSIHGNQTLTEIDQKRYGPFGVPEGTTCWMELTPGQTDIFICQAGKWTSSSLNLEVSRKEVKLLRTKRSTFVINRWENGGLTLTDQKATEPPVIICPLLPAGIYTEKGKVTTSVFWEIPTVNNTDNGVISVTQTHGQAPGTQHSEGKHTVSYMARDAKGQANICSQTFEVVVLKCPHAFTYILNGTAICTPTDHKYIYGSKCSYSCVSGYELTGTSSLQCGSDKAWNGSKPQCKAITCGSPGEIEHGFLACETSQYTFMSKCEIVCDIGHVYKGQSNKIICQANGQWTSAGQCQVKHCLELKSKQNTIINCSSNNTYGSVCNIACDEHYLLKGDATQTCQENETWSGEPSECIRICPEPSTVSHGHFVRKSGQRYQDTCTLICDKGYAVTGPPNITCDSSFKWSLGGLCLDIEAPILVDDLPPDLEVTARELGELNPVIYSVPKFVDSSGESVNVAGYPPSGSDFILGSTIVFIQASDSAGNNATFNFTVKVVAKLCHDPSRALKPSDPLRFHCPNGFVFGAVCSASCADGSVVHGMISIKCHLNYVYHEPEWLNYGDVGPYCQNSCGPGHWSFTGQQPCNVCTIGTYQAEYGTFFQRCPYGMVTPFNGAVSKEDCKFIYGIIHAGMILPLIQIGESSPESFTLMGWLHVNASNPRMTMMFSMDPANVKTGSVFVALSKFALYIIPTENTTARSIRYWYHVALVFERHGGVGSGKLYVNGEVVEEDYGLTLAAPSENSFKVDFTDTMFYFRHGLLGVSAFQMTPSALTANQMREFFNSCQKQVDNNLLAMPFTNNTGTMLPVLSPCDDIDNCIGNPCGLHGTCFDGDNKFTCECSDLWSGNRCQVPPNFCLNHTCANEATCINHIEYANFTCVCSSGYKGRLCKEEIVNGGWGFWNEWSTCSEDCGSGQRSRVRMCDSPRPDSFGDSCRGDQEQQQKCFGDQCPVNGVYGAWSDWSLCSAACGGGESVRRRFCDNPAPRNKGSACEGSGINSIPCNYFKCPDCSPLNTRPGHQKLDCKKNADKTMMTCQIICNSGLTIIPEVINRFQCGSLTNYTWIHQTDNNPTAILPDCAELVQPSKTSLVITYVSETAKGSAVQSFNNVTEYVKKDILEALNCNSPRCNQNVIVTATCEGESPVSGILRVEIIHDAETFTGEDNKTVLSTSQMLDNVFNNITTTSAYLLRACIDGADYAWHIETVSLTLQCPEGSGYSGSVCVDCPTGSYSAGNGSCILCGKDTYQDQAKMTSCKTCPECTSTAGTGSFLSEQCQSYICKKDDTDEDIPLPSIVGIATGLAGFFIVAVVGVIIYKNCRRHTVDHPYNIPGPGGLKNEDPYDIVLDEIYDKIEDNPYISAQGFSAGSFSLDSDGCFQPKDGYSNSSYVELLDSGDFSTTKSKLQLQDISEVTIIRKEITDLKDIPKRELPVPGIFDQDVLTTSNTENEARNADQDEQECLYLEPSPVKGIGAITNTENEARKTDQDEQECLYLEPSPVKGIGAITNTENEARKTDQDEQECLYLEPSPVKGIGAITNTENEACKTDQDEQECLYLEPSPVKGIGAITNTENEACKTDKNEEEHLHLVLSPEKENVYSISHRDKRRHITLPISDNDDFDSKDDNMKLSDITDLRSCHPESRPQPKDLFESDNSCALDVSPVGKTHKNIDITSSFNPHQSIHTLNMKSDELLGIFDDNNCFNSGRNTDILNSEPCRSFTSDNMLKNSPLSDQTVREHREATDMDQNSKDDSVTCYITRL